MSAQPICACGRCGKVWTPRNAAYTECPRCRFDSYGVHDCICADPGDGSHTRFAREAAEAEVRWMAAQPAAQMGLGL